MIVICPLPSPERAGCYSPGHRPGSGIAPKPHCPEGARYEDGAGISPPFRAVHLGQFQPRAMPWAITSRPDGAPEGSPAKSRRGSQSKPVDRTEILFSKRNKLCAPSREFHVSKSSIVNRQSSIVNRQSSIVNRQSPKPSSPSSLSPPPAPRSQTRSSAPRPLLRSSSTPRSDRSAFSESASGSLASIWR